MNNLWSAFSEESLKNIPDHFLENDNKICWYPSSWYDFRQIFFWSEFAKRKNIESPNIFLHSDYECLNNNPYPKEYMISAIYDVLGVEPPNPLLYRGYMLDAFDTDDYLVVKDYRELKLKEDVFNPNQQLYSYCNSIGKYTNRIFAIVCQKIRKGESLTSILPGMKVRTWYDERIVESVDKGSQKIVTSRQSTTDIYKFDFNEIDYNMPEKEVLILFFAMENSNFFYDVVLRNNISIEFLTHINDGGASMGGSNRKMDFIYLYSDSLGIEHMVMDYSIDTKWHHILDWESTGYLNTKVPETHIAFKKAEIDKNHWRLKNVCFPRSTGIYVKGKPGTGHHYWRYDSFFQRDSDSCESYYLYSKNKTNS